MSILFAVFPIIGFLIGFFGKDIMRYASQARPKLKSTQHSRVDIIEMTETLSGAAKANEMVHVLYDEQIKAMSLNQAIQAEELKEDPKKLAELLEKVTL
jgi:hypothetical protein